MRKLILLMAAVVSLAAVAVLSANNKEGELSAEQRRAKARYYYLEAAEAAAKEEYSIVYPLMEKAYKTDPDYLEAAHGYGMGLMDLADGDTTEQGAKKWELGANLHRRLIDAYPNDESQVILYARQLMTTPSKTLNGRPAAYEAIRVLERLDSIGSTTSVPLLYLSEAYSAMEMPDSVLGALSRYERREGSSPEMLENKVVLLLKSGARERALSEIDHYRVTHPRDAYPYILEAGIKYGNGEMDSAMNYLKMAEKLESANMEVKGRLSMLALELGDTTLFAEKAVEAIELPEGDLNGKMDLLMLYLDRIDFSENKEEARRADEAFTVLHGQFPQDPTLYLVEGIHKYNYGEPEKGLELINRSIALNPEDKRARMSLIQILLKEERNEEALEEIKKVWTQIGPQQQLRSLAVALAIEEAEYDLALYFLREAVKDIDSSIDPDIPFTLENEVVSKLNYDTFMNLGYIFQEFGDVYQRMNRVEDMARSFESAIQLLPNSPLILNNYAYYLSLAGESLEKAETMSQRAVTLDPGNPIYTDTRAWVLFKLGRLEEAEKMIKETIDLYQSEIERNPENKENIEKEMPETLYHYGEILKSLGRTDEAREQWERVLRIDPKHEEVTKALEKLNKK